MPHTKRLLIAVSLLSLLAACDPSQTSGGKPLSEQEKAGIEMARQMRKNGNTQGAMSVYRELMARENAPMAAYIGLASLYRKSGNAEEAVNVMREAQKRAPTDEKVLLHLGYALIAASQPEEAVNVFDMLTAINHDSAEGYNGKAVAFDGAGNHIAAQEIYQKALSLSPNSLSIKNNLALSFILNDQYDEAIALLEPLATQPGVSPVLRQNLALAYGLRGDKEKARSINLMDVSDKQAQENIRFYDHYSNMRHQQKVRALSSKMQPVMPDAMDDGASEPAAAPAKKPAAKAPEKPAPKEVKKEAPKAAEPAEAPQETPAGQSDGKFWGYDATPSYPTPRR